MDKPRIENWRLEKDILSSIYPTPYDLYGEIYNDKRFDDGTEIRTSMLKSINFEHMTAETQNTIYRLGKEEVINE